MHTGIHHSSKYNITVDLGKLLHFC